MKTKNWNIPVDEELDQAAMIAAHKALISKSKYIRLAVEEKIKHDQSNASAKKAIK